MLLHSEQLNIVIDRLLLNARRRLLDSRTPQGYWCGELSSSALSTATAVGALANAAGGEDGERIAGGLAWLAGNQNADGGWGDTTLSRSNISTTLLCWSAFAMGSRSGDYHRVITAAEEWITRETGDLEPSSLARAVNARYGGDRTFSAPILTMCALAGRLGDPQPAWNLVYALPFEVAAIPHRFLKWIRLPVVSYALPALVAIGQVRFHHAPPINPLTRILRNATRRQTLGLLQQIQPASGGYLEAVPLTSFVLMSLAAMGLKESPLVTKGIEFLNSTARTDGSWPIDTNLATWVTTLAINAGILKSLSQQEKGILANWLLDQQHRQVHPYTQAPPGGWAWTDLPGGVPDADDTAGAILALRQLAPDDAMVRQRAEEGIAWLLQVQNRDGGIPTFCRGWGALPFDRSSPDLTAHALLAWNAWIERLSDSRRRAHVAMQKAIGYLIRVQSKEGAWEPLWFGNETSPGETNRTYGTSRVVIALAGVWQNFPEVETALEKGAAWLLSAQRADGSWGGSPGAASSIEETAVALDALARVGSGRTPRSRDLITAIIKGVKWMDERTRSGSDFPAAPIGLYFARLWYYEKLYPLIFTVSALERIRSVLKEL